MKEWTRKGLMQKIEINYNYDFIITQNRLWLRLKEQQRYI